MFPPQKNPGRGVPPRGPVGPPPDPMSMLGGMPPPGMTPPGGGMDPMAAMMGGIGLIPPAPSPSPAGLAGPDGLPVGGSIPPGMGPSDLGGSALLAALMGSGDPYSQPPGAQPTAGVGTGDPNMGLTNLLNLLALGQMGVGGGAPGPGAGMPRGPMG